MSGNLKLEFLGGRVYRLHVQGADRFDIVRYISDMYRSNPDDFQDVMVEIVYDVIHPLSAKDKNFIKWRVRSFTAGNINVSFTENVAVDKQADEDKVIPLTQPKPMPLISEEEKEEIVDETPPGRMQGIILGTLRSGSEIDTDRGVVIVGDVHAGADIYTEGPVIVLGLMSGRIFILTEEKTYVLLKKCDNGLIIVGSEVYECQFDGGDDKWKLFMIHGSQMSIVEDKIGYLARRVKRWLEE